MNNTKQQSPHEVALSGPFRFGPYKETHRAMAVALRMLFLCDATEYFLQINFKEGFDFCSSEFFVKKVKDIKRKFVLYQFRVVHSGNNSALIYILVGVDIIGTVSKAEVFGVSKPILVPISYGVLQDPDNWYIWNL